MPDVNIADGRKIIDDAIAALNVWALGVPRGEELTAESAPPFQVAARAIDDLLDGAVAASEATKGLDFMYGHALVRTLEMALWNFMSYKDAASLTSAQLTTTAAIAASHLKRASVELATATPNEVEHA